MACPAMKHRRPAMCGQPEASTMLGQMMSLPLNVSSLLVHAQRYHADTQIVSRTIEGPIHRYRYADAANRSRRLARALNRLGVRSADRVGTLAWNGYRHFELYYAIPGIGAVPHTVNPRLTSEERRVGKECVRPCRSLWSPDN